MIDFQALDAVDPDISDAIRREITRQRNTIELIASENFTSRAVLAAMGSPLTNKYAEGYPGKRYYGGCTWIDTIEDIAIERAEQLFGAEHANVQPHSGAQANMAVYYALLNPGDTVMGMHLSHGGHLTHGSQVNVSGRMYRFVPYGVSLEDERIDYDALEQTALREHPKMIVAGASAYPRIIDFARLRDIADKANCLLMVDMAHIAGLVAAGVHPNPVPYADVVTSTTHKTLRGPRGGFILCKEKYAEAIDKAVFPGTQGGPLEHVIAAKAVCFKEAMSDAFKSYQRQVVRNAKAMAEAFGKLGMRLVSGGTDNHLILLDFTDFETTGRRLEGLLDRAFITVNKNTVPRERRSPLVTSGIRIGTPAVTTRGMREDEMVKIAEMIYRVWYEEDAAIPQVGSEALRLCRQFPLYE